MFGVEPPSPLCALISLKGVISDTGGGSGQGPLANKGSINFVKVRHLVEQAVALPNVVGLILLINCPGGSPVQTNMISDFIRQKALDSELPVYAFVEDVAASGGYWIACAADEIFVDQNRYVQATKIPLWMLRKKIIR